jgi:myo-inositol-1(or 4)-monophosphatase
MHPQLNIAVAAARAAARVINRGSLDLDTIKVATKQRNDFVTEVDQAAEDVILENLRSAYPDHYFLAEESGFSDSKGNPGNAEDAKVADFVWVIDPLDGTTNFIHGMPHYAISIALMQRGMVTQAVVYDPNRDELFTATKGAGAYLNNRRIRVSKRVKVEESLVGTGFPYRQIGAIDRYMDLLKRVTMKAAGVRRPGAAALDLAYVAAGRYDSFFELGLAPWDVAAGSLLVTEAGGLVGDFEGESNYLFGDETLAANPKLFVEMIRLLG